MPWPPPLTLINRVQGSPCSRRIQTNLPANLNPPHLTQTRPADHWGDRGRPSLKWAHMPLLLEPCGLFRWIWSLILTHHPWLSVVLLPDVASLIPAKSWFPFMSRWRTVTH